MTMHIKPDAIGWPPPCAIEVLPVKGGDGFAINETFDNAPDAWVNLGVCQTAFEANSFATSRHLAASNIRRAFFMSRPCNVRLWGDGT